MSEGRSGPIRSITILGGGTAGWMSAALLSRMFGDLRIRLIESDEIGAIGVGEATIPPIRGFNAMAGVDEVEMMKATQGTFKLGIEFVDWGQVGRTYFHGFGRIGRNLRWLQTHQIWLKAQGRGAAPPLDSLAISAVAARQNRFRPPDTNSPDSPVADLDYAYQFDASLYAAFLRRICEARGVERIEGRFTGAVLRPDDGFIDHLVLSDGRTVDGDLFIDCSGMRALLIGEALQVAYEDWNRWLLCDRALAAPSASTPELTPYTRSTARAAGWQWRIPLQHRVGNGHVYASAQISDQDAADALVGSLDGELLAEPRPVRFRPGRRLRTWEKNVLAIGLSGGFLEPLESTSIHMIHSGLRRLVALFPGRDFRAADVAEYNRQTAVELLDARDFVIAHYKVGQREDTPFWAHVKHMEVPDSLAERLDLFASSGRVFLREFSELFRPESWIQVLLGQGLPTRYDPSADLIPDEVCTGFLQNVESVIARCVAAMPTHAEYIADYCPAS